MKNTISVESVGIQRKTDHVLIASIILLLGVGLAALYSGSYGNARLFKNDGLYYFDRQIDFIKIGVVLFGIACFVPLHWFQKRIIIIPIAVLALLLTIIPFFMKPINGTYRWIKIKGISIQPSEFVKLVIPFYLAYIFDEKQNRIENFVSGILPQTLIVFLFCIIIMYQNDFSTAVFILLNALLIFFIAGVKVRYFIFSFFITFPFLAFFVFMKEHRLLRVVSFLWPDRDPQGAGYQVRMSVRSIASGGLWGKGMGQGTRKISSIPEVHSDFIFASFVEELGFIGVLLFFALILLFAVRGYKAAMKAEDVFRRLLAFGLVTMIVSQSLLNIGVVSGALPATGIPLPFFSAGGSSLVTTLVMTGFIVNISRGKKKKELSYDAE